MKNQYEKNNMHSNIKKFYDLDGLDYGYRRWRMYPSAKFDYNSTKHKILNYLGNEHFNNVLEIGCGPGTWTEILSDFANKITALDISSTMIKKAAKAVRNPKVIFHNIDIMEFETSTKYDLIFSIRAFEYFESKELFLKKCYNMLSNTGRLFIISKTKRSYWNGKNKIKKILRGIAPFLFKYEKTPFSKPDSKSKPEFCQKRMPVNTVLLLMKKVGFENFTISPVIIRPPIFMRGKGEIPLIPPFLEKPLLEIFNLIDKLFCNIPFFTFFAESYSIECKKK